MANVSLAEESDGYASVADLYDYVVPYRGRADIAFYVEAAKESGGPVLEVACGTGRVLIPTARAAIEITGVDSSARMLEVCRRKLADEADDVRSRVRLFEADMREFNLPQSFALVTIPFRPFQHLLTVDDQLACLASIRRHLADGGRLIFDLFNPSLEHLVNTKLGEETDEEPEFCTPDERRVIRRQKKVAEDRFHQVNRHELIYHVRHPDGREERLAHAFAFRYLFRFEVEHLLARAGFRVEQVYADFDKTPYGTKYPGELIFVTTKIRE
ncbi:MAG: methyltransferase domain-containing protein [Acidobacteriia bacterium]|nr:methyltransferase domain-containing protein [Terriglobia bacterium]